MADNYQVYYDMEKFHRWPWLSTLSLKYLNLSRLNSRLTLCIICLNRLCINFLAKTLWMIETWCLWSTEGKILTELKTCVLCATGEKFLLVNNISYYRGIKRNFSAHVISCSVSSYYALNYAEVYSAYMRTEIM